MKTLRAGDNTTGNMLASAAIAFLLLANPNTGAAAEPSIAIIGKAFYRNGNPWTPKGVDIEAFSKPPHIREKYKAAAQKRLYWGAAERNAIKNIFAADTLRIQVSQSALDPQGPWHDTYYVPEIIDAVREAEESGLAVIVAVDAQQDEIPGLACMPSGSTVRAWQAIAPSLTGDPDVMLELFNEPCRRSDSQARAEWSQSMQRIIDALRGLGSTNILLLDGLWWARSTNGLFPLVRDKAPGRLALAVHPYLNSQGFATEQQWRDNFGTSAAQYPLIASEWQATPRGGCVDETTPRIALSLMRYLESLHIGLVEWAIDWPDPTVVKDHTRFEPTDYASFTHCNDGSLSGGGRLLVDYPND
jgi:hypothetical protein